MLEGEQARRSGNERQTGPREQEIRGEKAREGEGGRKNDNEGRETMK